MCAHQQTPAARATSQPETPGANLRVSVACPNCGTAGWIRWTRLKHGLRCPKCQREFCIARNGQWLSLRDMPQVRYACPRCGKSGTIPSTTMVRRAECVDCRLPLVAGPDHQLHGAKEAAELHRAAHVARGTYRTWLESNFRTPDGRLRKSYVAACAALLVLVIGLGAAGLQSLFDDSPETLARRFTQRCLQGNWRAASGYLDEDDVQTAEFERWRTRHFASIVESLRPRGDKTAVEVELLEHGEDRRAFHVNISSPFLGARSLRQTWTRAGDRWCFDAQQTLAAEDGIGRR